jgi:acyl-CoA synthetase (AMP-forming)/AMP-acid ligase II
MNLEEIAALPTFTEVVRHWAAERPGVTVHTYLPDADADAAALRLAYDELDWRARALAGHLQRRFAPGDRLVVLHPPGPDFTCALVACMYAGIIAVPMYPPDWMRLDRSPARLEGILTNARPSGALGVAAQERWLGQAGTEASHVRALPWISTDLRELGDAMEWSARRADPDEIALIQYTSGSTAEPKGVALTHANLLSNFRMQIEAFQPDTGSSLLSWLPVYHDMGLGALLMSLYTGRPGFYLSPIAFLKRPARWLEAISRYRATTSGAPNFAYELTLRKTTTVERSKLDLRSWKIAFVGAEPTQADTLERFARVFACAGFRWNAFYPCYGLAEATLIVSGGRPDEPPVIRCFHSDALAEGHVEEATRRGAPKTRLVGCGRTLLDQVIAIVDPNTRKPCPPDRVGEVWVSGPNVSRGYWDVPEGGERGLSGKLADADGGSFLRTGDLGFVFEGELFITGRCKDVIIVRGRNHHPQDIEATAQAAHRALRPGGGVAFGVEEEGCEQLVIVHEVRASAGLDLTEVESAVRGAVWQAHGLAARHVVLIEPGMIPKTTNGKLRRSACRTAFLDGTLCGLATGAA